MFNGAQLPHMKCIPSVCKLAFTVLHVWFRLTTFSFTALTKISCEMFVTNLLSIDTGYVIKNFQNKLIVLFKLGLLDPHLLLFIFRASLET